MELHRLGRALAFIAGTIVGGLALAFVIVFFNPQLLQRSAPALPAAPVASATPAAPVPETPAPGLADPPVRTDTEAAGRGNASATGSFAAAVKRASPAVVNISTQRMVTEQIQPSVFDQMFG